MNQLLKSLRTIMLFVVFFVSTQPLSAIVGTTKGEFSVNQGTANYSLKIDVPPGVAGMEPKLSLDYSSSGGNGYMGVGWNIGGLSAITRCPQTKAVDGANHKFGVKYDENDRFCLDGQRLINVSGAYGADGTEYRTEIDTYSKITQKGVLTNNKGPNWFEVKTKSGLTYRYGLYAGTSGDGSAYFYINGRKVFWKVNDITDTYGNKITFHYNNDYATGENYLNKVTYSNNSVEYVYGARPDTKLWYSGGHQMNMTKRLTTVIVKTGTTEVRRYKVAYTNEADGSKRSKVSSITEQVAEGDLRTLQMTYDSSSRRGAYDLGITFPDTKDKMYFVDFNNDGFVDQVRVEGNSYIYFNKGDGKGSFNRVYSYYSYRAITSSLAFSDINNDGLVDVIYGIGLFLFNNGNNSFTLKNISKEFNSNMASTYNFDVTKVYGYADFDGDGYSDALVQDEIPGGSEYKIVFFDQDGNIKGVKNLGDIGYPMNIKIADFNVDGQPDFYVIKDGLDRIYINNGNKTFTPKASLDIKNHVHDGVKVADINGDGATDIYEVSSGADKVWLNDGKGNLNLKYTPAIDGSNQDISLVDMNGDGYPDVYRVVSGDDQIWLNDGRGNFPSSSYTIPVAQANYNIQFADINGDGMTDLVERAGSRNIWLNQAKKPLLTRITNNTDQNIYISYKNMTDKDANVYAQLDATNTKPWNSLSNGNIPLIMPMNLVYMVKSSDGVGGLNTVEYKYHDYCINKLYGSQGFRYIATFNKTPGEDGGFASGEFYKQIGIKNGDDDEEGFQYTGMPYYSYAGREYIGTGSSKSLAPWGEWLSRTSLTYQDASTHTGNRKKIYEPFTYSNIQSIYDPDTKAHIKTVYHYNYLNTDGLGNINKTVDRTYDKVNNKNFYKTTINEYTSENKTNWHIGRLTKATVTHTQTDGGTVARSSTFTYNDKGVLSQEVANAGIGLALTKDYTYDAKGNKIKETVSGYGITTATTTYGYSSDGKFQTSVTNAAGLTEKRTYDPSFGTLKTLTGPNELTTTWTYDGMGRKIEELRADGTKTTWEHNWWDGASMDIEHGLYSVGVSTSGKPFVRTYYDMLGREVGSYTYTMNKAPRTDYISRRILKRKYYNAKGELTKEELPHYQGESAGVTETTYDKYGRATQVSKTGPNGTTQTYKTTHSNFTSILTNPKEQKKQTVKNAIDQTLSITDAYGTTIASKISYTYDAAGNLKTTTDSAGNVISMTYDAVGNKTYMNDPDLGVWNYRYNAAGAVRTQWSGTAGYDGSKNATYKNYDVLGRLVKTNTYNKVEHLVDNNAYTYNYQTFTYGDATAPVGARGKLIQSYASSKTNKADWHGETKTMTYDTKGRPVSTNTYIYGKGDYLTTTTYDAYSRPKAIVYPNDYNITNYYNAGYLEYIKGSDGKKHYEVNEFNAFGEVEKASFANGVSTFVGHDSAGFIGSILSGKNDAYGAGNVQQVRYTYDGLGNVLTRNDNSVTNHYLNETFTYDAMNRLKRFAVSTDVTVKAFYNSRNYAYDKLGNMIHQDYIGDYTYAVNKPHAVTKTVTTSGATRTYTYDEVGNMTNRNGDKITYSPSNKPSIIKGKNGGSEVRFYYGVGGKRFMKTATKDGLTNTTYYLGKSYQEEVASNLSNEIKSTIFITVGGKTVGTHVETIDTQREGTDDYKTTYNRYFHTDALGSITAITDDAGKVVERRSYEPFGKIRAMDYGLTANDAIIPANTVAHTTRAFTGHEQIGEISGLVHMNARVYDSDIGRFLSADTIIQDPHDSQSYNRYSYVRNNPLVFTDPSGHSWFSKLWKSIKKHIATIVAVVVAVVVAIYAPQLLIKAFGTGLADGTVVSAFGVIGSQAAGGAIALTTLGGATVGAIAGFSAGFFGSLAGGASFGDAVELGMKAAFAGAITGGIGAHYGNTWNLERAAFHSLGGGVGSEIMGGSFKEGFKLAGALALVSWGYSEMTRLTNELKMKSVGGDRSKLKINDYGEIDTTGARGSGGVKGVKSWLSDYGMKNEGKQLSTGFNDPFNRFINKVSKTHDFQNSWHYNWDTGFFQPFTNRIGAELFEVYSFLGMPVAGVYTAVALGSDQILVTSQIYEGRR